MPHDPDDEVPAPENAVPQPAGRSASDQTEIRYFQEKWVDTWPWLHYDKEKDIMFCELCREAGCANTLAIGTNNFRTSTLTRHVSHLDHKRVIAAPKEKTHMDAAMSKAQSKAEAGVTIAMKAVFWLCSESLPMSKYPSLIAFLKYLNVPDIEHLKCGKNVDYTSRKTADGLLEALSVVIDENLTEKIKESPCVTVLTDESTDIVVHHKLAINIRIVHPTSLKPSTHFLSDVHLDSATGLGIFRAIEQELASRKIPLTKVYGLGTDGASVMTGAKTGLLGQFLRVNPHIEQTKCSAHRVALVSEQAADKIKSIKDFKDTVVSIYYYFRMSPTKLSQLEAVQRVLEEPTLRYREVHEVRWLSFYSALEAIVRTLDSLITFFASQTKDPKAVGMNKKIGQELFIRVAYSMLDWLEPIMRLSLFFQQRDLDISLVKVNVDACMRDLVDMRDDRNDLGKPQYASKLDHDLDGGLFKGHKIARNANHFTTVRREFLQAMIDGLEKRFPTNEITQKFGILGMKPLALISDEKAIAEWGNDDITALGEIYTAEATHEFEGTVYRSPPLIKCTLRELVKEWERSKFLVKNLKYEKFSTSELWGVMAAHHMDEVPNLVQLVCLALTHPVHTCDCERSFSIQNLITSARRNRLSACHIDQLMRVNLEGGSIEAFDFGVAVKKWRDSAARKIFQSESAAASKSARN